MNQVLENFSKQISPPDEFNSFARQTTYELLLLLQQKSRFPWSRFVIGGGIEDGKNTSTCLKCDVDVTVYVPFNSQGSAVPLTHFISLKKEVVLDNWFETLYEHTTPDHYDDVIFRTSNSLNFVYKGIWFDILAAHDFCPGSSFADNTQHVLQLQKISYKLLNTTARANHPQLLKVPKKLQSELTVDGVLWMNSKPTFCKDMARLCKFWHQSVLYVGSGAGKSFIIELLATKAAVETISEENKYLKAFRRFLELMSDMEEMRIIFTDNYTYDDIPQTLLAQHPLLLNPVNPYQNLMADVASQEFMKMMSIAAKETLDRLQLYSASLVSSLFKPQFQSNVVIIRNVVYKIIEDCRPDFMPTLTFHSAWIKPVLNRETMRLKEDKQRFSRHFMSKVCKMIGSVVKCATYEQETGVDEWLETQDIVDKVQSLLRSLSHNQSLKINPIDHNDSETENKDVRYSVSIEGGRKALVIAFDVVVTVLCDENPTEW